VLRCAAIRPPAAAVRDVCVFAKDHTADRSDPNEHEHGAGDGENSARETQRCAPEDRDHERASRETGEGEHSSSHLPESGEMYPVAVVSRDRGNHTVIQAVRASGVII
jgi:hypothetical protein